jgi:hypothetical protein
MYLIHGWVHAIKGFVYCVHRMFPSQSYAIKMKLNYDDYLAPHIFQSHKYFSDLRLLFTVRQCSLANELSVVIVLFVLAPAQRLLIYSHT